MAGPGRVVVVVEVAEVVVAAVVVLATDVVVVVAAWVTEVAVSAPESPKSMTDPTETAARAVAMPAAMKIERFSTPADSSQGRQFRLQAASGGEAGPGASRRIR